jgi:hypothetical protein
MAQFVELPADVQLDEAPAPAEQIADPQGYTPQEQRRIIEFAKTAKTPEELTAFVAAIGKDRGLGGITNAAQVLAERDANGGKVADHIIQLQNQPAEQPAPAPDVPAGYAELPPDAPAETGNLSGMTDDEVRAYVEKLPEEMRPGLSDAVVNGATAGIPTELASIVSTIGSGLRHPIETFQSGGKNLADAYHDYRKHNLALLDYVRLQHPNLATPAEVGGAIASPVGKADTLVGIAKGAAQYGLIHGFTTSNGDMDQRTTEALKEAGGDAVAGPAIGAVLKAPGAVKAVADRLFGGEGRARAIIAKAFQDDEKTAGDIGRAVSDAQANGVPMMLADTGENARSALAAAARSSGPARTIARDALEERQAGLADRVTGAIERDLGPVANPHAVTEHLMSTARNGARPLYDAAYARPGADAFAHKVAPLFQRPSMKAALRNAYQLAKEEGREPETLGFDINDAGDVTLTKVPSWQTMDYVKRGLDDVLEKYRDTTTGKLVLGTGGNAVNNTLKTFRAAFDKANPDYAAARAAYGGPMSGIEAMETGRKSLNWTADDLEARINDMTPFQRQLFALGHRRAMAELVASKGDTADTVHALIGTGKKRAMLGRLYGSRQGFNRFVETLQQEREGYRTFKKALLGSPTAANQLDDASLEAASAVASAAGGDPRAALSLAWKFGLRKGGERARKEVASLLSETDPARFREIARQLRAEAVKRGIWNEDLHRAAIAASRGSGSAISDSRRQGRAQIAQ